MSFLACFAALLLLVWVSASADSYAEVAATFDFECAGMVPAVNDKRLPLDPVHLAQARVLFYEARRQQIRDRLQEMLPKIQTALIQTAPRQSTFVIDSAGSKFIYVRLNMTWGDFAPVTREDSEDTIRGWLSKQGYPKLFTKLHYLRDHMSGKDYTSVAFGIPD